MACPCCVFCSAHTMLCPPVTSLHLCISESCDFSHIGLVYDFSVFYSFSNVGWMEWISCLVLSCLVFLSRLSFLLLMLMYFVWGMSDVWVCDVVCFVCYFIKKKKKKKKNLCFISLFLNLDVLYTWWYVKCVMTFG